MKMWNWTIKIENFVRINEFCVPFLNFLCTFSLRSKVRLHILWIRNWMKFYKFINIPKTLLVLTVHFKLNNINILKRNVRTFSSVGGVLCVCVCMMCWSGKMVGKSNIHIKFYWNWIPHHNSRSKSTLPFMLYET